MTSPTDVYKCPYSGIDYKAPCAIKNCWAHLKEKLHASGCVHHAVPKKELGAFELAYAFDKTRKQVKDRLETGRERLQSGVALIEALEHLQTERCNVCETCGKPRAKGLRCMNTIKCNQRKEIIKWLSGHEFFAEHPPSTRDFFTLLHEEKYRELLIHLFHIGGKQAETLEELFNPEKING